jgi:peptidoglycan/xylan/chitin deacetylase (PgdA/CDA1 family)
MTSAVSSPALSNATASKVATRAVMAALAAGLSVLAGTVAQASERSEQLVLISFDGAHDNRLWGRSLEMADRSGARFTYFLSCTFLMSKDERKAYKAPGHSAGRSNVGFARDTPEVLTRLGHIWSAYQSGHEIGNHGCGHFDGKSWSKADWLAEFSQFDAALENAWTGNGAEPPAGWARFAKTAIKGFRAPYLSTGEGLYAAMRAHGLSYDASTVSNGPVSPELEGPVARFALPLIPEGPRQRPIIGMDYNLFVRHSAGIENPSKSEEFEARALDAFRSAFDAEYTGERRPLQLGFHFVEMNGGAYWNALEQFVDEVCGQPEVACVTYQEAIRRLKPADGSAS